MVNMAYTGLVWFARVIQYLFFGELRVVESQVLFAAIMLLSTFRGVG